MTAGRGTSEAAARISPMRGFVELAAFVLVLVVPTLGVRAACSLAAYWGSTRELALVAGALVFPVLPLVRELAAEVRRRRRGIAGPRILTFGDRLTLRTLALSLTFLLPLVASWPPLHGVHDARGGWFLDDAEGDWAPGARRAVLRAAGGLVRLYDRVHENPWRDGSGRPTHRTGRARSPPEQTIELAGTRPPHRPTASSPATRASTCAAPCPAPAAIG
jgi:hypothetical protein